MTNAPSMLPILPLLLILLFPGSVGPQAGNWPESRLQAGSSIERRIIAALVQTARQEAEREALAPSITPEAVPVALVFAGDRDPEFAIRESDRVRDGPRT